MWCVGRVAMNGVPPIKGRAKKISYPYGGYVKTRSPPFPEVVMLGLPGAGVLCSSRSGFSPLTTFLCRAFYVAFLAPSRHLACPLCTVSIVFHVLLLQCTVVPLNS
eukprot:143305-Pleurochrysis_carterae.AAC.1